MSEAAWITMWVLLSLLVFLPILVIAFTGSLFLFTMKKSKSGKFNVPFMDISFYLNSPIMDMIKDGIAYMKQAKQEDIEVKSFDGLTLRGYYFPAPNGNHKKVVVGMHGFKSSPANEYSPYIKFYQSMGYDMIIPYERAHGKSDGKYISMGVHERLDTVSWANYAVQKLGDDIEILLHGVSMGAAAVASSSCENLPQQVKGIISDCAFNSVFDETIFQLNHSFHIPKMFVYLCNIFAKIFIKYDFKSNSAEQAVKNSKVPILFVHGRLDQIVPVESSIRLYNACTSKKKLFIVENANHAESFARDNEKYVKTFKEFFNID